MYYPMYEQNFWPFSPPWQQPYTKMDPAGLDRASELKWQLDNQLGKIFKVPFYINETFTVCIEIIFDALSFIFIGQLILLYKVNFINIKIILTCRLLFILI